MACTRAAVVDFEINSLTGSDDSNGCSRDLTSEPVPGLIGEIHGVNCAIGVHPAWSYRG
jgi:hypothetical protein